ncbi:Rho guanine nucleotide exchange factor 6 [Balamuthia mandrillaris]
MTSRMEELQKEAARLEASLAKYKKKCKKERKKIKALKLKVDLLSPASAKTKAGSRRHHTVAPEVTANAFAGGSMPGKSSSGPVSLGAARKGPPPPVPRGSKPRNLQANEGEAGATTEGSGIKRPVSSDWSSTVTPSSAPPPRPKSAYDGAEVRAHQARQELLGQAKAALQSSSVGEVAANSSLAPQEDKEEAEQIPQPKRSSPVTSFSPSAVTATESASTATAPSKLEDKKVEVRPILGMTNEASTITPRKTTATPTANKGEASFVVRAIQSYKAKSKDHLSFSKGASITVTKENEGEGLFYGKLAKKEGWFPSYYVKAD